MLGTDAWGLKDWLEAGSYWWPCWYSLEGSSLGLRGENPQVPLLFQCRLMASILNTPHMADTDRIFFLTTLSRYL